MARPGRRSTWKIGGVVAKHGLWMPMYWADYLADTQHFSTYQHGAYLLLIGAYWCRGGPLPADEASVARMTKSTKDKVARYLNPVLAMFTRKDGLLYHQRIDSEILRSSERLASAKANGRAGGLAKSYLTTITKERKTRGRARPSVNGVASPALSPEQLAELQDKTDRIMKRGKYEENYQ